MRHLVFGLVMALLLSSPAISAGPSANAFITDSGISNVTKIDGGNGLSMIPVGGSTQGVAMDPTGARVYVASSATPVTVYAIDPAETNLELAKKGSVSFGTTVKSPFGIAISPDGKRLFLAHGVKVNSVLPQGAVSIINIGSGDALSLGPTMTVFGSATGVAVSPSGDRVYVANFAQRVSVIDPAHIGARPATQLDVLVEGSRIVGVAVSPDGTRLYAADAANNKLIVIDTTGLTPSLTADPVVKVVSCFEPEPAAPLVGCVAVGGAGAEGKGGSYGVAVSGDKVQYPKGKRVFVTNTVSNTLTVIDPMLVGTTMSPVKAIVTVGSGPHGVAVTSDSAKVYVVNRSSRSVSVLDVSMLETLGYRPPDPIQLIDNVSPVGFGTFLTRVVDPTIPVVIDVIPKVINLKAHGTVPVVIFGSAAPGPEFDVQDVDLASICLNGWEVKEKPNGGDRMANFGDFNGDGLDDVMVHVDMDRISEDCAQGPQAASSNPTAMLKGKTKGGIAFEGSESVTFLH